MRRFAVARVFPNGAVGGVIELEAERFEADDEGTARFFSPTGDLVGVFHNMFSVHSVDDEPAREACRLEREVDERDRTIATLQHTIAVMSSTEETIKLSLSRHKDALQSIERRLHEANTAAERRSTELAQERSRIRDLEKFARCPHLSIGREEGDKHKRSGLWCQECDAPVHIPEMPAHVPLRAVVDVGRIPVPK